MQQKSNTKTFIEISEKAIIGNARYFKKIAGAKTKVGFVVKSNAYGHGLMEVAGILAKETEWFCVDNIDEAMLLRNKFKNNILVIGYIPPERLKDAISSNISFTVYDIGHLKKVISLKNIKPAKIHLKVETGMHRQGVVENDLAEILSFIKNNRKLRLEGVSTHFATADYPAGKKYYLNQLQTFLSIVSEIRKKFSEQFIVHAAATAASINYQDSRFDMIRVGIGVYGLYNHKTLTPALTWRSEVAQVKFCEKGDFVSYGATWIAKKRTKIAVIPVGYADGFGRGLSNKGYVLIGGRLCRVLGRVCMNMFMVDVSRVSRVKEGDRVIIIGKPVGMRVEDVARLTGTISYEVVSRLNPMIPRKITI